MTSSLPVSGELLQLPHCPDRDLEAQRALSPCRMSQALPLRLGLQNQPQLWGCLSSAARSQQMRSFTLSPGGFLVCRVCSGAVCRWAGLPCSLGAPPGAGSATPLTEPPDSGTPGHSLPPGTEWELPDQPEFQESPRTEPQGLWGTPPSAWPGSLALASTRQTLSPGSIFFQLCFHSCPTHILPRGPAAPPALPKESVCTQHLSWP